MKKIRKLFSMMVIFITVMTGMAAADPVMAEDYGQAAKSSEQLKASQVGKYGMLPIYGIDVKDGVYSVDVESSSSMFRIVKAELTVKNGKMEAVITLSGTGYLKLFIGTGQEAAAGDESEYISFQEDKDGKYSYRVPVKALDTSINCAAFSKRKEKWYDRQILFEASSLPEDALLVELPDYDAIEAAMRAQKYSSGQNEETETQSENLESRMPAEPMEMDMEDGEYSIQVDLAGGSGKASIVSPTILVIKDRKAYAQIRWGSSNYDYMIVGNKKYLNRNEGEGNSIFEIPVSVMDIEMPVIADTTAMGTPHEVNYSLTFYSSSIGPKSQMPQEAAKRVVAVAGVIIVGGGILNYIVKKRRRA